MKFAAESMLFLSLTLPSLAQPWSVLPKFHRILGVLRKDSLSEVSRAALLDGAARQLDSELQKRGLPGSSGNAEMRVQENCRKFPELCQDGTVLRALVTGASKALDDPYLTYLEPPAFTGLSRRMRGQEGPTPAFTIIKEREGEPIKVLDVGPEGPASLRGGDSLLTLDDHPTASMSVEEARARLEGVAGSRLHLSVSHGQAQAPEEIHVTRLESGRKTVEWSMVNEAGSQRRLAHLRIRNFASTTPKEVEQALAELRQQNVEGLVVDLRNNGGGLVTAAVGVCEFFLPGGTPVVTLQRRRQAETLRTHGNGYAPLPMVVLLNQESASAAEIMASALHDAKAATLVGTRSFGKGTVQRHIPLGDGSGLKFTSARYRTPAGVYIHGTGITPDVSETGDALARGVQLLRQRLAASV